MEILKEGVDYCFIYPKDDKETVHIRFLLGPYKDTIFKYGKVKFVEKDGVPTLQFAFDVLESKVMKPKVLQKDKDFERYLFELLVSFISTNLDEEIIDENRRSDIEELDL